ncbi:hypothetical protein [Virgibacillus necropolis]|nr:hypothetical protein [Virgibacillus necropolis]
MSLELTALLVSAHRGFFGSKPFSKANQLIKKIEDEAISWGAVNP